MASSLADIHYVGGYARFWIPCRRAANQEAQPRYGVTVVTAVPHEFVLPAYSPNGQALPGLVGSAATDG